MSIKTVLFFGLAILLIALVFMTTYEPKRDPLKVCENSFRIGFEFVDIYPRLSEEQRKLLEKDKPEVDTHINFSCQCLIAKSRVFRDEIIPKMDREKTDTYWKQAIDEMKKYQSECKLPAYFTWNLKPPKLEDYRK